jgi:hypothetical protein
MGGFANTGQENQPTQVYYDPGKQQYFSYKQNNEPVRVRGQFGMENAMPMNALNNLFGLNADQERMYLNNPYMLPDRFTTNAQATPYAELTNLFPSLNNNAQSLLTPSDAQSSGAGRFLASSNISQGK